MCAASSNRSLLKQVEVSVMLFKALLASLFIVDVVLPQIGPIALIVTLAIGVVAWSTPARLRGELPDGNDNWVPQACTRYWGPSRNARSRGM